MESTTQDLALSCILSSENNSKTMKMRSYIILTLFHGYSSKFEKHVAEIDAKGDANFHFNNVNVDFDYLCFEVFIHRKLLSNKHVGDVNVLVSEIVIAGGQASSATYELGKASGKAKKVDLKVSYKLSSRGNYIPAVVSGHEKPELES